MKAIGAQNKDILQIFLIEAGLLGLIGGLLGRVLLGGGLLLLPRRVFLLGDHPRRRRVAVAALRPSRDLRPLGVVIVPGFVCRAIARTHLGAIVLECTNMVPYAPDISVATGLPVYSIHTLVRWMHMGLCPPRFAV